MDGWWDCQGQDEFFCRILKARLDERVKGNLKILIHGLIAFIGVRADAN